FPHLRTNSNLRPFWFNTAEGWKLPKTKRVPDRFQIEDRIWLAIPHDASPTASRDITPLRPNGSVGEMDRRPDRGKNFFGFTAEGQVLQPVERPGGFWFGSLIGVSAVAALVGLLTAWRAFARQQQLSEMKSNFVSSVSHELRAPIASVRLMAESLERGKISETAKQHDYFRFIGQECRR